MAKELFTTEGDEGHLNLHTGQQRIWESEKRFVFMLAGTQAGKTAFGPWWLNREIERRGSGDYLAVTSTYDLFKLKLLPEFLKIFDTILHRGRLWAGMKIFELRDPDTGKFWAKRADDPMWARIILRSANAEGGLESATANAAWLDEVGQKDFTLSAWEAVLRRLSLTQGRVLGTTTLYNRGWMKSEIYDKWRAGDSDIEVVQFDSTMNPLFPKEEFERARKSLPPWKFNMFYRGQYDIPAGLIYDAFDDVLCKIPPFAIPDEWPGYVGLDFGGVHQAAIYYAQDPETKRLYAYREYLEGGRSIQEHAEALKDKRVVKWMGGSSSEEQWRREFRAAGIPVEQPPVSDVEVGIDLVYGCHKANEIYVFDTLSRYLDEKGSYSRKLDASGTPTEQIEDKEKFHIMDSERYIVSWLRGTSDPVVEHSEAVVYRRPYLEPDEQYEEDDEDARVLKIFRSAG